MAQRLSLSLQLYMSIVYVNSLWLSQGISCSNSSWAFGVLFCISSVQCSVKSESHILTPMFTLFMCINHDNDSKKQCVCVTLPNNS